MPNRSEQRNQSKRRTDWVVRIPLFFACIATATLTLSKLIKRLNTQVGAWLITEIRLY